MNTSNRNGRISQHGLTVPKRRLFEFGNVTTKAVRLLLPRESHLEPVISILVCFRRSNKLTLDFSCLYHIDLQLPSWKSKKRARIAQEQLDPLERFQQFPVDESIGAHEYWLRIFDSSGVGGSAGSALQHSLGQDLARMGLEISSIPAMSTEAERIFSG